MPVPLSPPIRMVLSVTAILRTVVKILCIASLLPMIDSRPPKRFAEGHITTAMSIPVEKLKAEGKTVVIVSHHLDDLFRTADSFAVLSAGRIVFRGGLSDLCLQEDIGRWGLEWPPRIGLMRRVAEKRPGLQSLNKRG